MDHPSLRVAVIGAGPAGLAAMKCLQEEGFHVTGFEQRPDAGGLWTFSENPKYTSATNGTRYQLSKFLSPFTDFPFPEDFPLHPTAPYLSSYYLAYAKHFGIYDKILFNAPVTSIRRDEVEASWLVTLGGERTPRLFDKVVVASGTENVAKWPDIDQLHAFRSRLLHGQAYKRPQDFEGETVVVIGQGNSAADCAVELVPHTRKVYLSHRRGARIFPRMVLGKRFDAFASWKLTRIGFFLGRVFPILHRLAFDSYFQWVVKTAWGEQDAEWRFEPAPSSADGFSSLIVNDQLIPELRAGNITSIHGVKTVTGPRSLELDDGTVIDDIGAIIACTGYEASFSMVESAISFSQPHGAVPRLPNLFQNIFPLEHADSLAFLNYCVVMESATTSREVAAMAIAQVWAGKSRLPAREEMQRQVERHQAWYVSRCLRYSVPQYEGLIEPDTWLRFINEAAGTGVYEHFGWTWAAWIFFLREPVLYWLMAWGVCSPFIYRVFETGKRKAWPGAREAIFRVNEQSDVDLGKKKPKVA